jgi:hypothetical protein
MKSGLVQIAYALLIFLSFKASAATLYVNLNSTNPVPPFADWTTAANNIQDAVDTSTNGDLILVTNGVYGTGGRLVPGGSTLDVEDAITVQSVNGPTVTAIQGYQVASTTNGGSAVRCVYLGNNATLIGFTLTNGATTSGSGKGGGIECQSTSAVVSNCIIVENAAVYGGGTYSGTLINCILSNNVALQGVYNVPGTGGGSFSGTLNNCLLVGNSAQKGGAVATYLSYDQMILNNCTIYGNSASQCGGGLYCAYSGAPAFLNATNCIIVGNSAPSGSNYFNASGMVFDRCCITPLPEVAGSFFAVIGVEDFTNGPLFIDPAINDFHLQSNSPCINSGNNTVVAGSTDLDGNPRIVGGTVDIGAYEYQAPVSKISYAWLQQYGLPISTNIDIADLDGTGFTVYQDWIAGLNPTNSLSLLAMLPPVPTNNPAGFVVSWQSVSNRAYFLQSSTNLAAQPAFSTIQSNIAGQPDLTSYTDTITAGNDPVFYRVGVQQ